MSPSFRKPSLISTSCHYPLTWVCSPMSRHLSRHSSCVVIILSFRSSSRIGTLSFYPRMPITWLTARPCGREDANYPEGSIVCDWARLTLCALGQANTPGHQTHPMHACIQTAQRRHTHPRASTLSHTASPHMGWDGMWGRRWRGLPSRCCWKSNTSPLPLPLPLPAPLPLNIY